MLRLWLENLAAYSVQIAALLAIGGLALQLLRVRMPRWRLLCWQMLLAACLVLPFAQPWRTGQDDGSVQISSRTLGANASGPKHARVPIAWDQVIAGVLITGTLFRLGLFGLGLLRLRAYRRRSLPQPDLAGSLRRQLGVNAELGASDEIPGPVTFGFFRPVVLVPPRWLGSESVLCHELLHVRRGDWLFMAGEEVVRALLWFHPLVWYAIGQIQLAREEVVDREVVQLTQSRERYLETLLAIAAAKSGLDLAPAPLFLRKRHLRKRVASLMKEVSMSRVRLNSSLAGFLALTLAAGWVAVRAFPLQAAPQNAQQETTAPHAKQIAAAQDDTNPKRIRVGGNVQSEKLIKKVTPVYPPEAKAARIQGTVRLSVLVADDGTVKDIEVVAGHPLLVDAAIPAVRQWIYSTTLLNGEPVEVETLVDVNFTLSQ